MTDVDRIALFHTGGCEQVAFFVDAAVPDSEPMYGDRFRLLDGTRPPPGTKVVCGSCGELITRRPLPWREAIG